jgi:hypothetical protein
MFTYRACVEREEFTNLGATSLRDIRLERLLQGFVFVCSHRSRSKFASRRHTQRVIEGSVTLISNRKRQS